MFTVHSSAGVGSLVILYSLGKRRELNLSRTTSTKSYPSSKYPFALFSLPDHFYSTYSHCISKSCSWPCHSLQAQYLYLATMSPLGGSQEAWLVEESMETLLHSLTVAMGLVSQRSVVLLS